jgi:hypothetical protein
MTLQNDVNVPSKSNKLKKKRREKIFVGKTLKVTDEKGQGPDPDPDSLVRGTGTLRIRESGSVPKCHGSGTLL